MLIDLPFLVDWYQRGIVVSCSLTRSEKQGSARRKGEAEAIDDLLLHCRLEVDQEIAADDQIDPGKRRVLDDIMCRENDHTSD